MSDLIPQRTNTTMEERIWYWEEVEAEAWELSRDQFQIWPSVGAGAVGFSISLIFRGWEVMEQELLTTVFIPILSAITYLVLVYVGNYLRAMMRVPVHHQRGVVYLTQQQEQEINNLREVHEKTEGTVRQRITELEAQLDRRATRRQQRELIGRMIKRGQEILPPYGKPERAADTPYNEWVEKGNTDLRIYLGESYESLWGSYEGSPAMYQMNSAIPQRNQKIYSDIIRRIQRLREFHSELGNHE